MMSLHPQSILQPEYTPTPYIMISNDEEEDEVIIKEEEEQELIPKGVELWGDHEDEFYMSDHMPPTLEVFHLSDS